MNQERWDFTCNYLSEVFGREPPAFARIREHAQTAGLPLIAISPDVGRFLSLLTSMTRAKVALEIGTLGGYSAAWISRGLAPEGRLISFELDHHRAEVARASLAEVGVSNVEIRVGDARDELVRLALTPGSVDVVFVDADKESYERYFELVSDSISPGGLFIADNVLGTHSWWIDLVDNPTRTAIDRFNRKVANDDRFEVIAVPIREGVLVARRRA